MSAIAVVAIIAMGVVLGMTGGGGSILAVPILIYLLEVAEKSAIATSLLLVGATSLVAMVGYLRAGHVDLRIGAIFGVFGMLGAYIGGALARFIPGGLLIALFAALMLGAAFAMFRPSKDGQEEEGAPREKLPIFTIGVEGTVVGVVTGLVGAGGGFLVVPALVLMSGLSMKRAVGTSLMVIAMKSFAGFAGYASHAEVDYRLAGIMIGLAVVGAIVGSMTARFIDGAKLRLGFGVFVLMMGVFVLVQQLPMELPVSAVIVAMLGAGLAGTSIAMTPADAVDDAEDAGVSLSTREGMR